MRWSGKALTGLVTVFATVFVTVVVTHAVGQTGAAPANAAKPSPAPTDLVARGRYLIITHACGECHGGGDNPAAKGWRAG